MRAEEAELVALKALGWLAADDEMWPAFLSATGATPGDLRAEAGNPVFLAAVLDFLSQSDDAVTRFCDEAGLAYEAPMRARMALPGGAETHWT